MIAPVYGAESTTLNVKFVGSDCEGCEVSYSSLPDDAPPVNIKNNAATFDFPEGTIDPGYFIISNPKFGFIDAATVTVMQYKGKSAGQKVLRKQAKSAKRSFECSYVRFLIVCAFSHRMCAFSSYVRFLIVCAFSHRMCVFSSTYKHSNPTRPLAALLAPRLPSQQ